MSAPRQYHHQRLACGAEFALEHIPGRQLVAYDLRVLTGMVDEPDDRLGLAHLVEQTITKGTAKHNGQGLLDAFDSLGAQAVSYVGREAIGFRGLCLPEYLAQSLALHAEVLRTPTFPDDPCRVAVELAQQNLTALEDQPDELAQRMLARQTYGPRLGRHPLGDGESLSRITRDDMEAFWRTHFGAVRMQISMAGPVQPRETAELCEQAFAGFGAPPDDGRAPRRIEFTPGAQHRHKELEQQQIFMSWPGVPRTHADYPAERVTLALLSDGMSSRLFTEVREKLGLVYWVGAWAEHPRGGGMMFAGASTTPQRCDETYRVLLREIDRLAEDISEAELERGKKGLIAKAQTHGDITKARAGELSSDLFFYGQPMPLEEKVRRISSVTAGDVRRYLHEHPRDRLAIATLGPRALQV